MTIEIVEQSVDLLREYGAIPMSFTVDSRYRVEPIDRGLGGWTLTEERVEPPYVKDYDDVEDERPIRWSKRWDLSNWVVLAAVGRGSASKRFTSASTIIRTRRSKSTDGVQPRTLLAFDESPTRCSTSAGRSSRASVFTCVCQSRPT